MQSTYWIQQLIKSIKHQQTQTVLDLLNPAIALKNKEKFTPENIIDEIIFHLRQNFESGDEQTSFQKFAVNFLMHSKLQDQVTALKQQGKPTLGLANEVFNYFYNCISGFELVCEQPYMDGKWIALIVDYLCRFLIQYGIEADLEIQGSKEVAEKYRAEGEYHSANSKLEKAQSLLEILFRRLQQASNPPPDNRRFADFFVALRIIKIQFKLNNFKSCERFFKWNDTQISTQGYSLDLFPSKYRVMLSYYKGRFYLYRNDFTQARNELRFAFAHCHNDYQKNKKKILKYLIPVEMNLFKFPTKVLLQKYQLSEYIPLAEATINGDMIKFEQTIDQYMDHYVQSGVFLAIEKLRHLALRNLIKRVALAISKDSTLQDNDKPHIIKLEILFHILKEWDPELDLDELECLLANQIYMGFIKGYISHEKRLMVLGQKADPFPLKLE